MKILIPIRLMNKQKTQVVGLEFFYGTFKQKTELNESISVCLAPRLISIPNKLDTLEHCFG